MAYLAFDVRRIVREAYENTNGHIFLFDVRRVVREAYDI